MTRRSERVQEAIRRLASEIIHEELKDPRLRGFITIIRAEITPDLRFAKIYYSVFGDEKNKKLIAKGLESAKVFVRKRIVDELKLRFAPDVIFKFDESASHEERIERILDEIHSEEKDGSDGKNCKST